MDSFEINDIQSFLNLKNSFLDDDEIWREDKIILIGN